MSDPALRALRLSAEGDDADAAALALEALAQLPAAVDDLAALITAGLYRKSPSLLVAVSKGFVSGAPLRSALLAAIEEEGLSGAWLGVFKLIGLSDVVLRMWAGVAADPVLASIPMFIFMGAILERSGSAKDMLSATEVLLKWCPGALAVAVMVMGTILAAPIGVVGAAVITLSVIALPQMLAAVTR